MTPIRSSQVAPAMARENPHASSARGRAEAILQPGSVSEVEPFLVSPDIRSAVTTSEIGLTAAPSEVENARRKERAAD